MAMFPDDKEIEWMATEGRQGEQPKELIQLYKDGGYYMLRSNWAPDATMMVLKNNNNPKNYVHCQPDNGTFSLYRNGRNFLPDAGFLLMEEMLQAMLCVNHIGQQPCIIR